MKKSKVTLTLTILLSLLALPVVNADVRSEFHLGYSNHLQGVDTQNKIIFGEDDRLDYYDVPTPAYWEYGQAVAAMILPKYLKPIEGEQRFTVTGKLLRDKTICTSERFTQQRAIATCSGFLVGPDLLATAGHCMRHQEDCDNYRWVFNYHQQNESELETITNNDIYSCGKIIARKYDSRKKDDWALIKLDREVTGRTPLKIRRNSKISDDAQLLMIGYPSGLPQKFAKAYGVNKNKKSNFFVTTLDTFGGNSGSPVINLEEGVVEGVLVRGGKDYEYSRSLGCAKTKYCSGLGWFSCKGADVTRIGELPIP
jgi:V8-like Glu-specific endopeptidase